MSEYHAIKWVDGDTATRKTREVDLICKVIRGATFHKENGDIEGVGIVLTGTADNEHHLIEDASILLKKMTEKFCGGHHG